MNKQCHGAGALSAAGGLTRAPQWAGQWGLACAWGQPALPNAGRYQGIREWVMPWRNASLFLRTGIMG